MVASVVGKHHFFNPTSHGSQNGQVKFCARSGSQGLDKKQGIDFFDVFSNVRMSH